MADVNDVNSTFASGKVGRHDHLRCHGWENRVWEYVQPAAHQRLIPKTLFRQP
jgi:hypothetical protein